MLTSLSLVFLVGLAMAALMQRLHIPRIVGMLLSGIILGPYVLNFLDPTILGISSELRKMALVIILIKAGISLDISDLKRVGRPAVLLSFLPAVMEILACVFLGPYFLPITRAEGAIIGSVLGAVSPAIVVPRMVMLMEEHYGTEKSIPQLLLAGASLDDVFVIVLFSTFVNIEQGGHVQLSDFSEIPLSILFGILLGCLAGLLLSLLFEFYHRRGHHIRNSLKLIILLAFGFLLMAIETQLQNVIPVSGLLAVMSMACVIRLRMETTVSDRLAEKYGKLWLAAEVLLFVLVGAAVDIRYTLAAGPGTIALILVALCFRSIGTWLCLYRTILNRSERLFCVISYLPKATVQAAIGAIPLSLNLSCGPIVLSAAVLSILITAPLGALGIDLSYQRLLSHDSD